MARKTTRKTVKKGKSGKKTTAKKKTKKAAPKKTAAKKMTGGKTGAKKTSTKKAARKTTAKAPPKKTSAAHITDFNSLVSDKPAGVKAVARKLREIVYELVPDAQENFFGGRPAMALYRDGREICGIQPLDDRCHFYLTRGEKMKDPDRLLEGGGKGIRHVKVRSVKDMPVRAIKKFIREGRKLAKA